MNARSPRNIETRKKKAQRKASTGNTTRNQGNTSGIRRQSKKRANIARARAE
jgi:hypothetical protein